MNLKLTAFIGFLFLRGIQVVSAQMSEPQTRKEWEMERLKDPELGRVPEHIRFRELAFIHGSGGAVSILWQFKEHLGCTEVPIMWAAEPAVRHLML